MSTAQFVRTCQAIFQDSLVAHIDEVNPPLNADTSSALVIPPSAAAAGRQCLQRVFAETQIAATDLPFTLRLAVATNGDSLVQQIVARQLTIVGSSPRDRAAVLQQAVNVLVHNNWGEIDKTLVPRDHQTAAHSALARQYAAEADQLRPAGQTVVSRLHIFDDLNQLGPVSWNADTDLARDRYRLHLAQSVSQTEVPVEDWPTVRGAIDRGLYLTAEAAYIQSPTHANLTRFVAVRDSMRGRGNGTSLDSLLGQPAPRLEGSYWFNTPTSAPPVVPAPNRVTLLVFLRVPENWQDFGQQDRAVFKYLQDMHTRYPALAIVLVAQARGVFDGEDLRARPEDEAGKIDAILSRRFSVPGMICVIETKYHTEAGMTAIPLASPILNRFHLDPRDPEGTTFLIDRGGWIAQVNGELNDHLIQQLIKQ